LFYVAFYLYEMPAEHCSVASVIFPYLLFCILVMPMAYSSAIYNFIH